MWTHQHTNSWSLLRRRIKRRIKMLKKRLPRQRWNSYETVIVLAQFFHDNRSYLKDNFEQWDYAVLFHIHKQSLLPLPVTETLFCLLLSWVVNKLMKKGQQDSAVSYVVCLSATFLCKLTVTVLSLPIIPISCPSRQEWTCLFIVVLTFFFNLTKALLSTDTPQSSAI